MGGSSLQRLKLGLMAGAVATAALPAITTYSVVVNGGATWTVPEVFTKLLSVAAIGESGAAAAGLTATRGGAGAGGGGFALRNDATTIAGYTLAPGNVLAIQIGQGAEGKHTWMKDAAGTVIVQAARGTDASGATAGTGGQVVDCVGDVKHKGGNGGIPRTNTGNCAGGGGGGAGSAAGDGVNGAQASQTSTVASGAGGANGDGDAGGLSVGAGANGNPGLDDDTSGSGGSGSGTGTGFQGGRGGKPGGGPGGGASTASAQTLAGQASAGRLIITFEGYETPPAGPEALDIIVGLGDSLMGGRGTFTGADVDDPRVVQFYCGLTADMRPGCAHPAGFTDADYRTIKTSIYPLGHREGLPADGKQYGPLAPFGSAYAALTGRKVMLVPGGVGGSTAVTSWASGGSLRTRLLADAEAAIVAAKAINPSSNVKGFVICLGTNDANLGTSVATVKAAVIDVIAAARTITGAADAWVMLLSILPEGVVADANFKAVDSALRQIAMEVSGVTFVQHPRGAQVDILHPNRTGSLTAAQRGATALQYVDNPRVIHTLDDDATGTAGVVLGMSDICVGTVDPTIASSAQTGVSGNYLTAGSTFGPNDFMGMAFDAVVGRSAMCVEFVHAYDPAAPGRSGPLLLTQAGACVAGGVNYGPQAYAVALDPVAGTIQIYRNDAAARVSLGSLAHTFATGRLWRVWFDGRVRVQWSTDGGATWSAILSGTLDTTYTSGGLALGQWANSQAGKVFFDAASVRRAA